MLTVGYTVSRGLAKAGSREPFWSKGENDGTTDAVEVSKRIETLEKAQVAHCVCRCAGSYDLGGQRTPVGVGHDGSRIDLPDRRHDPGPDDLQQLLTMADSDSHEQGEAQRPEADGPSTPAPPARLTHGKLESPKDSDVHGHRRHR
jgi:hypothetical protein